MIETVCSCGAALRASEAETNQPRPCAACGAPSLFVAGEKLPDGAGTGDFDGVLVLPSQRPDGSIESCQYFLGGVREIEIGKLDTRHIVLTGTRVSRSHCKLVRVDFGPSRWKLIDNKSTNGTFVNGEQIAEQELNHGDVIDVGDNELTYHLIPAAALATARDNAAGGGKSVICPSCGKQYAPGVSVCVPCSVDIRSGRPVINSYVYDEQDLKERAWNVLRRISWAIPFGLYPVASEAFGKTKPIAIWVIVGLTIIASFAQWGATFHMDRLMRQGRIDQIDDLPPAWSLMLWSGKPGVEAAKKHAGRINDQERAQRMYNRIVEKSAYSKFHGYQLLTNAFLHEDHMHLAGNLVFLIVFGTRVNALIGNVATAILYPFLAVAASLGHMLSSANQQLGPALGASGAIMGLAGMYFILFPVHRIYMVVWFRYIFTGFRMAWKLWALRGFWVLLFFISFDVIYTSFGLENGVAHWAHLGGFITGMAVALFMLITRLVNARGSDLLSRILGRRAWFLIGRPVAA
jgi:membrane associated rhomboid family serine protease